MKSENKKDSSIWLLFNDTGEIFSEFGMVGFNDIFVEQKLIMGNIP